MSPFIIFAGLNAFAGLRFYQKVDETIYFQSADVQNLEPKLIEPSDLLKKAANIQKGSDNSKKTKVAKITKAKLQEVAETKMPDLNAATLEAAMKTIAGSARSMGIEIID